MQAQRLCVCALANAGRDADACVTRVGCSDFLRAIVVVRVLRLDGCVLRLDVWCVWACDGAGACVCARVCGSMMHVPRRVALIQYSHCLYSVVFPLAYPLTPLFSRCLVQTATGCEVVGLTMIPVSSLDDVRRVVQLGTGALLTSRRPRPCGYRLTTARRSVAAPLHPCV